MNKELAGPNQRPVNGLGLFLACELVTGPGTVVEAGRNRGLWLIYLKSQSAKDALIIEGISNKQRTVTIHARDPVASRGPSKKITISELGGGAVAQSVELANPGQEVPGSIPAVAARSLLVGSVSV